jgi:hypothetical protein
MQIHASLGLRAISLVSLLTYAFMLLGAYDTTFHSVDSVRDVALARLIADGAAFPVVSQPWAATYQTPPAYLYLLSIPFFMGGDERAAFIFVALLCLLSVIWVWRLLYREYDPVVGTLYAVTALVFPTSIFFHSAGNPSFAFAASTLALGCAIRVSQGARGNSVALIVLLFLLPQLHLSSVPIVAALGIWLFCGARQRLSAPAIGIGLLLAVTSVLWLWKFGFHAPEYSPKLEAASQNSALVARFIDPNQWAAIATVYLNYATHLRDTPSWLSAFVAVITLYFVVGMVIAPLLLRMRRALPGTRIVIATAIVAVLLGVAYLESWGVWYFDSWLPWIAVAAAITWGSALARIREQAWLLPIVATIGAVNIAPQLWVHATLARQGYVDISPSALFASRQSVNASPTIPVLSARHQLAYRDFVAAHQLCLAQIVGVSAWYVHDMSRRDGYRDCKAGSHPNEPVSYLQLIGFAGELARPTRWRSGPLHIQELPPQPKIWIDGEARNSKYGVSLARYGLYLPIESMKPTSVSFAPRAGVASRVNISLRCIGGDTKAVPYWAHENVTPSRFSITLDRKLFALRYLEYQFDFPASTTPPEQIRLILDKPLNCDVSVFVE